MKTKMITSVLLLLTTFAFAIPNPTDVNTKINKQIKTKYQDAIILERENEDGNIEIEIVHKQKEKKVIFSNLGVWQLTKYDLFKSELPQKIKNTIKASKYSSYVIDEIKVIETPTNSIYEIELDKMFDEDITIYVKFDGEIL